MSERRQVEQQLSLPGGVRKLASWLPLAAVCLVACGGADHYAPLADEPAGGPGLPAADAGAGAGGSSAPSSTTSITESSTTTQHGTLDLSAFSAFDQGLGSLKFAVRTAAGDVVSSGFNEVHGADMDRRLLLQLPVGSGFELSLDSKTSDQPPVTCSGSIGPFDIEPNVTSSYQAFLWQCEGVPKQPAPADECYWLADWVGAAKTHAAVGESIELRAAGHDAAGAAARFTWVNQAPQFGDFSDKHAAQTSFTCTAAKSDIPLLLIATGDGCSRHVALSVSCQ